MLHKDMMFRFNPELEFPTKIPAPRTVQSHGTEPGQVSGHETAWLILRVAGNTLAGAVFLGALLAMPLWLDRLMSLL